MSRHPRQPRPPPTSSPRPPTGPEHPQPLRWRVPLTRLLPLILVIATTLAYSNSLHGPLVCDDVPAIADNPTIRQLWPPQYILNPPRWGSSLEGRPLSNFSLALNFSVHGQRVFGYHVTNLALHLANALVLFGLVRRLLRTPEHPRGARDATGRAASARSPDLPAFAVALLWAVHPLTTQAVTYIVQRAESLAALCYLLTLYAVVRSASAHRDSQPRPPGRHASWLWAAAAIGACSLGMCAKETMVSAPLVALAMDRIFLADSWRQLVRRRAGLHAALFATWGLLIAIQLTMTGFRSARTGFDSVVSPWNYLLTESGVIIHYLRLAFWPRALCFDYSDWPLAQGIGDVWPAFAAVSALLALTIVGLWRAPRLAFPGLCVFAVLAPTSSIMPVMDLVQERRMYLPLAALLALVVSCGIWVADARDRRRLLAAGASAPASRPATAPARIVFALATLTLAFTLGILTYRHNTIYRSELALWTDTLRKRPGNAQAGVTAGAALLDLGKIDDALALFDRAIQLKPDYAMAHNNRGLALHRKGQYAEALQSYDRALAIKEFGNYATYNNRGLTCQALGLLDRAMDDFTAAIDSMPMYALAYVNRGRLQAARQRDDDALADFNQAVRFAPERPATYMDRGNLLAHLGRHRDAVADFSTAMRFGMNNADVHFNRANSFAFLGDVDEALADYARALALNPGMAPAYNNRASLLYTVGRMREAWQDIEACRRLGATPNASLVELIEQGLSATRAAPPPPAAN